MHPKDSAALCFDDDSVRPGNLTFCKTDLLDMVRGLEVLWLQALKA
jgi:hypothetical protein